MISRDFLNVNEFTECSNNIQNILLGAATMLTVEFKGCQYYFSTFILSHKKYFSICCQ